jgi:hypothetical protein
MLVAGAIAAFSGSIQPHRAKAVPMRAPPL